MWRIPLTPLTIIHTLNKDIILRVNIKRLSINLIPIRARTIPIQEIRILLQRRARKVTIRALIIARHERRIIIARPSRTASRSLDTPSSAVLLGDVRSVSNGGGVQTPSVGAGAAVLRDAVGPFFDVRGGEFGGGGLVDFVEVGFVGEPAGLEGGDFGGDDVVRAG